LPQQSASTLFYDHCTPFATDRDNCTLVGARLWEDFETWRHSK
jgi:hypothetical protein